MRSRCVFGPLTDSHAWNVAAKQYGAGRAGPLAILSPTAKKGAPTCAGVVTSFCWNMSIMSAFHCSQGVPGSVILKRGYLRRSSGPVLPWHPQGYFTGVQPTGKSVT